MKKSILILATFLLISCHKETAKPAAPAQQTNSTPVSTLNTYEVSMVGNWKLSKSEYWSSGVAYPTNYSDTISCRLELRSDLTTHGYKKTLNGLGCAVFYDNWKADDVIYLNIGGFLYKIHKLTADSLIFSRGDLTTASGGSKYYLWK